MILRHKVPTIFNIYMLDVICCALGCVVLLWQVAHQQAETQTGDAKQAQQYFERAKTDLLSASVDVTALKNDIKLWRDKYGAAALRLAQTEKERDDAQKLAGAKQDSLDKTRSLLNLSEAQLKKLQAELEELLASEKKTKAELTGITKLNAELLARIALSERRIDTLKGEITLKQAEVDASNKKFRTDLEELLASEKKTKAELTGVVKINAELLARIALSERRIDSLKGEITLKQGEIDGVLKRQLDQTAALRLSEENLRKLQKLFDSARDESKDTKTKLMLTELQLKMRQQDLEKARDDLVDLTGAKDKLLIDLAAGAKNLDDAKSLVARLTKDRDQFKAKAASSDAQYSALWLEKDGLRKRLVDLEAQAEQRFAGIPLTGENVVFLIDISGSMILKDEDTPDPDKWPFLCETLMKLMKSIPTLRRFQVILFSDKVSYLYGGRDKWYKYEGPETAQMTRDALRKVKVEGGTNMHDAFEEAFRYRKHGDKLDTIYLFSDGLPNIGPGVPAAIQSPNEAQKNFHMAKYIREKLKGDWNRANANLNDVRINAVGFFFESPDVGAFLWALAREHRGSFVGLR
ncbi:MAG: VWA domain-containing protein [Planctomycetes bacterium]|nr:VWA domain-containing protein [Planctomycetota bacterium]